MTLSLAHGFCAAAASALWLLLVYALGGHTVHIGAGHYANYGTEIMLIIALWLRLHRMLHRENRYWLPVWQGLWQGLVTSFAAAMGVSLFLSLYLNSINPDYPDLYLEWRVAAMRMAGDAEESVRSMAHAYRWSTGRIGLPITVLSAYLLFGLIASPLLTLWLNWRRKDSGRIG